MGWIPRSDNQSGKKYRGKPKDLEWGRQNGLDPNDYKSSSGMSTEEKVGLGFVGLGVGGVAVCVLAEPCGAALAAIVTIVGGTELAAR